MEEYKKQAEGQASFSDPPQVSATSSSPMGMMQLPSRRGRGNYPLDLVPGGVSDSTYEAAVLGELAVISIEPEVILMCRNLIIFI